MSLYLRHSSSLLPIPRVATCRRIPTPSIQSVLRNIYHKQTRFRSTPSQNVTTGITFLSTTGQRRTLTLRHTPCSPRAFFALDSLSQTHSTFSPNHTLLPSPPPPPILPLHQQPLTDLQNRHFHTTITATFHLPTPTNFLPSTSTATPTMSDDAWAAFLHRANQPAHSPSPEPIPPESSSDQPHATTSTFLTPKPHSPALHPASHSEPPQEFYLLAGAPPTPITTYLTQNATDLFYISDTESPFLPVTIPYHPSPPTTHLPSPSDFAQLLTTYANHPLTSPGDVTVLRQEEFDPRGEYAGVFGAVGKACAGREVSIYRVQGEGARVEYFIVGVERVGEGVERGEGSERERKVKGVGGTGGKIVGVRVLAVES